MEIDSNLQQPGFAVGLQTWVPKPYCYANICCKSSPD